ncbi:hypothetical protein TSUD_45890 [Trifolium subterraneum]|nr:hypothetical protein TSUD_45890 [Trifolium subterraneum]
MGLVGKIPISMGLYLKKLTYFGIDNNKLDGLVPDELGLLKFANEINLENNNMSGRITFLSEVGEKFKLAGNITVLEMEVATVCVNSILAKFASA